MAIIFDSRVIASTLSRIFMHFVDPGKMNDYRNDMVPEVILLHEKVAEHYGISSINLAKEVIEELNAKK